MSITLALIWVPLHAIFYVADVIGYITNVGKSAQPRTGSNERGRTLRVTLWGKLGDELLKMMSGHSGNYTVILTSTSAKFCNGWYKDMSIQPKLLHVKMWVLLYLSVMLMKPNQVDLFQSLAHIMEQFKNS